MSLAENVRRLTEDHWATVGKLSGVLPPLLDQLEEAVTTGGGRKGGKSTTVPLPIAPDPADLLASIESEVREYHREHFPRDMPATAKAAVAKWAALEDADQYLEHATLDWCDLIGAMVSPRKPRRPLNQPCPSCGETATGGEDPVSALTAWCWDEDEAMVPTDGWDVLCGVCGAEWRGPGIAWLLASLEAHRRLVTRRGR